MQEGRTEQNERRTLQRKFDVRSLEKGEHTPHHLFDSLCKNSLSRNVRASCRSHHPPNGGSLSASKGDAKGRAGRWASSKRKALASAALPSSASQAQPSPAIHSDVPISMSTRPGRLQLYWHGSLPH